jgi:hypothetical protein
MLMIYGSDREWATLSEEEQRRQYGEYAQVSALPQVQGGAELQPATTATTVRAPNGEVLTTDGPFAETKEVLGGYYLVDCEDLDEAIEIAARIPAAKYGGAVEVRPLVERA